MDTALINDLLLAFSLLSKREMEKNFKAMRFMNEIKEKLLWLRDQATITPKKTRGKS